MVLLCGTVPAYRALHVGVKGPDVRQLNRNLHQLGYDTDAHVRIDPADGAFTPKTEQALRVAPAQEGRRRDRRARDSMTWSSCPRRSGSPRSPASSGDRPGRALRC